MPLLIRFCVLAILLYNSGRSGVAWAQQDCFRPPAPVESLDDVRNYLILQAGRSNYAITDECLVVRRQTFGRDLRFAILNRFPKDTSVKDAYIFIKSNRIFTTNPPIKISLSRGLGWFMAKPSGQSPMSVDFMAFVPYTGNIDDWNAAHSVIGTPAEMGAKLGVKWHAYAMSDLTIPSTLPQFWNIDTTFDRSHGVRTNYLIRFDVNTDAKLSLVPFEVFVQPEVREVELTLLSNIDSLSGTYRFVLE